MALVVMAGAVFVAAAPRVLQTATVDDLRETLTEATPDERNVRFDTRTEIGAGAPGVPFSNIEWIGEQLRDDNIPASVLELVSQQQWVFDTPQFTVSTYPDQALPRHPPTFRFRHQSEIDDHLTVLDGSLPVAREPEFRLEGPDCPVGVVEPERFEPGDDQECEVVEYPVFETAITEATAVELGFAIDRTTLEIGDRFMLQPDQTQLGFRGSLVDLGRLRLIVEISGWIELDPPEDEFWYGDILLHRPRVRENNDFEFVFGAGLLGGEQYRPFRAVAPGTGLDFSWRYLIDPSLIEDTDSEELVTDLEKIAPVDADAVTLLPELLQEHLAQRRLTLQVWSMVGLAFAVAAVAAIATLARAESVRRAPVDALQEGRGASRFQLLSAATATAVTVVVGPAAVGAIIAWLAVPEAGGRDSILAVSLFGAAALAAMVGVAGTEPSAAPRVRRLVGRGVLAIAALAIVALLRRRETGIDEVARGDLDPTLMLAPVLLIAAIAVFGTDGFGPLARVAARGSARSAGPVWFVGLRRVAASTSTIRGPLLAVAMATALSIVAAVLGSSIGASQDAAARQRVGAEARVETTLPLIPLPGDVIDEVQRLDVPSVFATALAFQRFEGPGGAFVADVLAIDRPGTAGDGDGPVPVTLVGPWDAPHLPGVGDLIDLENSAFVVSMEVTDQVDQLPGVRAGTPTVLVDRSSFGSRTTDRIATPDLVLIDDASVVPDLAALVDDRPGVALVTRAGELDRLAGDPLSTWTTVGLLLAGGAGLVLAVVASIAATVIHAAERRRDLGLVTVLGASRRVAVRMALAELAPVYGAAALLGVVGGVVAVRTLGPNLTFEAFADGAVSAGVVVEWPVIATVVGAIAAVLAVVLSLAARGVRRLDHAMMLREGTR